jgi:hypothetical protein
MHEDPRFPGTRLIEPPRALTERERTLLLFLLSEAFSGRDELLGQAESVVVFGECACGCGTVDLALPGRPITRGPSPREVVAEASNFNSPGPPVQVLLHTADGVLREMEIVWYTDREERASERIAPAALTLKRSG